MKAAALIPLLLVVTLTTCGTHPRRARAEILARERAAAPAAEDEKAEPEVFPRSWAGTYRGTLDVVGAGGKKQSVNMEFRISPTEKPERTSWVIGFEGQPKRNYELVTVDAEKGEYQIDERNSIVVPARLLGDELVSVFAVSGNQLVARYRLDGEKLTFEVTMWRQEATGSTGGKGGVPVVTTFDPQNVQRAVLGRVEE